MPQLEIKGYGVIDIPENPGRSYTTSEDFVEVVNAFHNNPMSGRHYDGKRRAWSVDGFQPVNNTLGDSIYNTAFDMFDPGTDDELARRDAIRHANQVRQVAEFMPGLGEGMDLSESKAAFGRGQYLEGTVLGIAGAIGIVPGLGDAGKKALNNPGVRDAAVGIQRKLTDLWHGSPHSFDRFDLSKIGTGEGAQAYGHGLYLAEDQRVASSYLPGQEAQTRITSVIDPDGNVVSYGIGDTLANDKAALESEAIVALDRTAWDFDRSLAQLRGAQKNSQDPQAFDSVIQEVERLKSAGYKPNTGNLYQVEANVDPDTLLDWDKPLSEQPQIVAKLREAADIHPGLSDALQDFELKSSTGQTVIGVLQDSLGTPERASRELNALGIPGIRYLDATSRAAGEGTSNYVIFDDSLLNITSRNGEPVTGEARAQAMQEMGLDMSQAARMQRAQEMGFDTSAPVYHGSPDFRPVSESGEFSARTMNAYNRPLGEHESVPQATYFARDRGTAATYADDKRAWDYQNAEPEVFEGYISPGNALEINARGQTFRDIPVARIREQIPEAQQAEFERLVEAYSDPTNIGRLRTGDIETIAPMLGYDSFKISNVVDDYTGKGKPTTIQGVFDPSRIRSVNAAFDPAKKDSSNLLASPGAIGAGAAVVGGAAYQSEQRNKRRRQRRGS